MSLLPAPLPAMIGGLFAVLALALPAAAQADGAPDVETQAQAEPLTRGEIRLAKLLEGRVAGEPVRCIRAMPNQRMQTIQGTAYVYHIGKTIYVQRTRNPDQIDDTDALVTTRFAATELCRLDQMQTVDRVNGFFTGAVFFEDFVPYTKASAEAPAKG